MSDIPVLVDPQWLQAHPEARVVDVRWAARGPSPRERYDEGHVPGAAFADLDRDLSQPGGPGRHPFPTEDAFATVLSRLAITPTTHVVAYDQRDSSIAARFWFMLRAFGHERVSLLDGGLDGWVAAGMPLSREEPRIDPAPLRKLQLDRSRVTDVEQVKRRGPARLLDARAPERYRGETEPLDSKAGHIPGARNAPFSRNLDAAGRFLPGEQLRQLYEGDGPDVIVSCGSGVTACHLAVARELAGLPPARLYVGSWSGWIEDPSRPVAIGPEPG
jgi:thiosulfate/3-mercaptopyruvate sulfurtransferase